MDMKWGGIGIRLGLNWTESEDPNSDLLRVIISKELKSVSDWGLILKISQT